MMDLYCYRDYLGIFERGKIYRGEEVIMDYPMNGPTLKIRVYNTRFESRYFNPSSEDLYILDWRSYLSKLSDYFMSIDEWREKQISEIIL